MNLSRPLYASPDQAFPLPSIFFAREPEPDPDLDDIPGDPPPSRPNVAPPPPPHRSSSRPVLLFLVLILFVGVAYVAMNPEMFRGILPDSILDLFGEPPQVATAPPGNRPESGPVGGGPGARRADDAGGGRPAPPAPGETAPLPPIPGEKEAMAPPRGESPEAGGMGRPMPGGESDRGPQPPPQTNPPRSSGLSAGVEIPQPKFAEGQHVVALLPPASPGKMLSLSGNSSGTQPGPVIRPGATLTVLDGDLQGNTWIYAVRTQDGVKGWIPETQLKARP